MGSFIIEDIERNILIWPLERLYLYIHQNSSQCQIEILLISNQTNTMTKKAEQNNSLVWSYKTLCTILLVLWDTVALILWLLPGNAAMAAVSNLQVVITTIPVVGEIRWWIAHGDGSFNYHNGYGLWTEVLVYKVAGQLYCGVAVSTAAVQPMEAAFIWPYGRVKLRTTEWRFGCSQPFVCICDCCF